MADQNITIGIGTSYDGQGIAKAVKGSQDLLKATTKAGAAVGRLAGSIDELDKGTGLLVSRVSRLASAFLYGGWIGAAVTGFTLLIDLCKKWGEELDKAEENRQKLKIREMTGDVDDLQTSIDKLADSMEKLNDAQEKVAKSAKNVNDAHKDSDIIKAKLEGAQKESSLTNANDRAVARAETAVNTTRIAGEKSVNNAQEEYNKAATAEKTNAKTVALQEQAVEKFQKRLDELNEQMDKEAEQNGRASAETVKAQMKVSQQLAQAEGKLAEAQQKQTVLANNRIAAQVKLDNEKNKAELENLNAQNALKQAQQKRADAELRTQEKANREQEKAQEKEERAMEKEERERQKSIKESMDAVFKEVEQDNTRARLLKKENELRENNMKYLEELEAAQEELKDAEKEYAHRLRNAQVAVQNSTWQGWAWNNFIPIDQITGNGINGQNRYSPRNNASKNDAGYLARVQAGYERNAASQGFGLSARDRARQNELYAKARRGTALSDKELAELKALNDRDPKKQAAKAAQAAKEAAEKLQRAQEAEKTARMKFYRNLDEIHKWFGEGTGHAVN